jgi:MscS family membrane protein
MENWYRILVERWYWREIFVVLLILLVTWAASYSFSFIMSRIGRRWVIRPGSTLHNYILEATRRSVSLLILLAGIYAALHRYRFRLLAFLDGVIFVVAVALVISTLIQIGAALLQWYGQKIGRGAEGETVAREMLPMADKILKILLFAIGLLVVLDHFSIDVKSILVTLGVGSLAVGLALQDTLANMFGGFTIMLDRPFRVGDRIQLATGELGDVQLIGMRSTTVLMPNAHLLIIPNAYLVKTMLINHSLPDPRGQIVIEVTVAYSVDIAQAKRLMLECAKQNPMVMQSPEPVTFFKSFGDSGLSLMLVCHTKDFRDVMPVTDNLNSAIQQRFKSAQIEVPFPTRGVFSIDK